MKHPKRNAGGDEAFPRFPDHRDCQTMTSLLFSHLPAEGAAGQEHRFAKGEDIWESGDRADRLYFLRTGQVVVFQGDPDNHGVIIRLVAPGEPFGELCFCTVKGGVRPTTARAVIESDVVEMSVVDFFAFLRKSGAALPALMYTYCIRLAEAERRVEVLSHRGAENRLGHLLLQLASSRGRPVEEKKQDKRIDMTHEDLAGMAAMNRSHVTVTMGKFRKKGLLSYGRDQPLVIHVTELTSHLGRKKRSGSAS